MEKPEEPTPILSESEYIYLWKERYFHCVTDDGKKWKITYQTGLLGAPGRVKVQPGDIVVEVEPPDEDGYVLVENAEGQVGSIAVNCAGNS